MSFEKIDRVHFHTFDALRFLSFLLVFLRHSPVPQNSVLHYFSQAGGIGVSFFFVLSGFLITYILILEKLNHQNKVPLKKFFKRRILRIWPLYYAMVVLAFCMPFILPLFHLPYSEGGYEPKWFFTCTFLENYVMMFTRDFPRPSVLVIIWSLCIEEHFYIIWGLIFYFISLKNIPKLIISCIVISFIARIVYDRYQIPSLDIITNIDSFAFGAIPAYIFVFRKDIIQKLNEIPSIYKYLYSLFVLLVIIILTNTNVISKNIFNPVIFGILFSVLILFTLGEKNVFMISDKTVLAKLGKYTYGLYLVHPLCIGIFSKIGKNYDINWLAITFFSFISSVILSFLSYHFFEKQFLKLK